MRIGFIGLGIMGKPMAANLIKAGYDLVVYDVHDERVGQVVGLGAEAGSSPRDVASKTDMFITMLPNSPEVLEVLSGDGGILETAAPGSILVDMSSISPLVAKEIHAKCAERGVRALDAPVSGGEPGAINATLSIMVGGEEKDFEECKPILQSLGKSVVRVGQAGAGQMAKLANQIMVAVNIAGMAEALTLAAKAGVDPGVVYKAVRGGLAGSAVLDAKAPLVLARRFQPGFRIRLHIKDMANALDTGRELGVPMPVSAMVMQFMQALRADGKEELDHGAIANFYESLAKVEIRSDME